MKFSWASVNVELIESTLNQTLSETIFDQTLYISQPNFRLSELLYMKTEDVEKNIWSLSPFKIKNVIVAAGYIWCYAYHRSKITNFTLSDKSEFIINEDQYSGMQVDDGDLPVFNLSTIAKATNNFTVNNKIGEGGFGPVYRVNIL